MHGHDLQNVKKYESGKQMKVIDNLTDQTSAQVEVG